MMCERYYTVRKLRNREFDLIINWNIPAIAKGENKTGFIIQHMRIESHIDCVQNNDYWEAWYVIDGNIEKSSVRYDDSWSPIPSFWITECEDEIKSSDGLVIYRSKVYWIPKDSEVYNIVDQWQPDLQSPAQELKMTYHFDCDVDAYFVCERNYTWQYKNILKALRMGGDEK